MMDLVNKMFKEHFAAPEATTPNPPAECPICGETLALIDCPRCDGQGWFQVGCNGPFVRSIDCLTCNGDGEICPECLAESPVYVND